MQTRILAIGQKMPSWVEQGCQEYLKRMPRELGVEIVEIPLAQRKGNSSANSLKDQEAAALKSRMQASDFNIALDEQGKQWNSRQWGEQLESWMMNYPRVNLLIGGPDGLSEEMTRGANQVISLGKMTLPHPLVRIVLCEQLYRAWSIVKGHPYHRE